MAKKKKNAKQQTFLSPEQYIREKARSLEIGDCFINENYKENGLENYWKGSVTDAVAQISFFEHDRRPEVIAWFGELLAAINQDFPSATYTDATLNGLIVCNLLDIGATELLSQIKTMYDNGFVNLMLGGDFAEVETSMIGEKHSPSSEINPDIKERYALLR